MTDVRPREPGYRGALPPREDRLARIWVVIVIAIFLLMFVLSAFGLPSRLIPEATPVPVPTLPPASVPGSAPVDASPSVEPVES